MTASSFAARLKRPRILAIITVVVLTVAALVTISASAMAYGSTLRDGERLLAGTTIASVPVGDGSVDDALAAVAAHLEPALERTVTVTYRGRSWETTPRELGAATDLEEVVATAAGRADDLDFADLVKLRWLGSTDALALEVTTTVPEDEVAAFVAEIAEELDRAPRDAEVAWVDDAVVATVDSRAGRDVQQDAAVEELHAILAGEGTEMDLPLEVVAPSVTSDTAEEVASDVTDVVSVALDRSVTVTLDGRTETVTPRDLGASPDVDPLITAAFAGDDLPDVALRVGDDAIGRVIDTVSAGSLVAARDASLDLSGKRAKITPERNGVTIDRAASITEVRAALAGASDRVELELRTVRPAITADSFDRVLVVDASDTSLTLIEDGAVTRSWPVAVGTNNSPTPLGTFVVGAKRFEPTWVNPARDRWGKDMPERIGPGPDNPLGARAINWNTPSGSDTLIRFHGTPNEDSIGSAASNGCVRMFNKDVIELFDLVSPGTTIISRA
jgi:lipoprotein-anchoring transpeptidase ErfK/SrfK